MNPLEILRTIWRHKLAVIPVALLTMLGLLYVTVLTPATYEVTVSYVLVPPPRPPSPDEVARDPALAGVRADNPFVRFQSASIVVDLLARQTDSADNREQLLAAGADERFQVLPSNRYGFSSPIIDVLAVGSSASSAMATARLVSASVEEQLHAMQAAQQVDEPYMYRPLLVDFPAQPRVRVSNKLRSAVAVLLAGGILLFGAASIAEALGHRPARRARTTPVHLAPADSAAVRNLAAHEVDVKRAFASGRTR